ncbi:MAG: methyl-accepting chemotaxis protein, partial [Alkalilacustris sp.]
QEINSGVNQLDEVTQANAAALEEATASAQTMHHEAERLAEALTRFATSQDGAEGTMAEPVPLHPVAMRPPAPDRAAPSALPGTATGTWADH